MYFPHSNQFGRYQVADAKDRTMDGIQFASKAEMRRYAELKLRVQAGEIRDLTLQPKFLLQEGFTKNGRNYQPIYYVGDFEYYDCEKKKKVVEDVKGVETEVFKIKEKMLAFKHNIELRKVKTSEIGF
jgi:hypothetical protein